MEPPFYSGSRAPPVQRSNLQLISFLCPRLKVDFVVDSWHLMQLADFLTRRSLFELELSSSFNDILDSTTGSMFHLQVGWTRGTSRACWQHLWQLLVFWRHTSVLTVDGPTNPVNQMFTYQLVSWRDFQRNSDQKPGGSSWNMKIHLARVCKCDQYKFNVAVLKDSHSLPRLIDLD